MDIKKIREMLPVGSYSRIAEETGKAEGTVAQFFIGKSRVSEQTREAILREAAAILQEFSEKALETADEIRATA